MTGVTLAPGSSRGAALMETAVKGRGLWDDARRRLTRSRAAVTGVAVLGILVVLAVAGP